jgi:hypothetical protein
MGSGCPLWQASLAPKRQLLRKIIAHTTIAHMTIAHMTIAQKTINCPERPFAIKSIFSENMCKMTFTELLLIVVCNCCSGQLLNG